MLSLTHTETHSHTHTLKENLFFCFNFYNCCQAPFYNFEFFGFGRSALTIVDDVILPYCKIYCHSTYYLWVSSSECLLYTFMCKRPHTYTSHRIHTQTFKQMSCVHP